MIADLLLELRGGPALGLRLAGHDQARRRGGRRFQRLAGEEDQRGLQDGKRQGQERRRQKPELDTGCCLCDDGRNGAAAADELC